MSLLIMMSWSLCRTAQGKGSGEGKGAQWLKRESNETEVIERKKNSQLFL